MRIYFDGSCGPKNPGGKACYGFVINDENGERYRSRGLECKGPKATNNVAEYAALKHALKYLKETGYTGHVEIRGDSNLVVSQIRGDWKCKKEHLQQYLAEVSDLLENFESWDAEWIPREENTIADALSKITGND